MLTLFLKGAIVKKPCKICLVQPACSKICNDLETWEFKREKTLKSFTYFIDLTLSAIAVLLCMGFIILTIMIASI